MKHKFEYVMVCLLIGLLRILPLRLGVWVGSLLGNIHYLVDARHRRLTLEHLQIAFGTTKTLSELKQIARNSYKSHGRSLAESIYLPHLSLEKIREWVKVDGLSHYVEALKSGKGVIILTAHLGNWEIIPKAFWAHSLRIYGTVRPLDNPYLNKMTKSWREQNGMGVINKGEDTHQILKLLRDGAAVGFLLDQNTHEEYAVFVDFFGSPAATNKGVALLAIRSGATVVPVFMQREKGGRAGHRMTIDPPLTWEKTGSHKADMQTATALFTKIIEAHVARTPDQWLWIHRRWKTKRIVSSDG
jgi:KDO2-lipid IV(A) lauroyltransferase